MAEYIEQCKKCFHFQVCAQVMKNQLFIREKMLKEENPECEHFVNAADVVEVVRCKNCIHLFDNGLCYFNIKGVGYKKPKPNDFCSYGKRKEGDDNA